MSDKNDNLNNKHSKPIPCCLQVCKWLQGLGGAAQNSCKLQKNEGWSSGHFSSWCCIGATELQDLALERRTPKWRPGLDDVMVMPLQVRQKAEGRVVQLKSMCMLPWCSQEVQINRFSSTVSLVHLGKGSGGGFKFRYLLARGWCEMWSSQAVSRSSSLTATSAPSIFLADVRKGWEVCLLIRVLPLDSSTAFCIIVLGLVSFVLELSCTVSGKMFKPKGSIDVDGGMGGRRLFSYPIESVVQYKYIVIMEGTERRDTM